MKYLNFTFLAILALLSFAYASDDDKTQSKNVYTYSPTQELVGQNIKVPLSASDTYLSLSKQYDIGPLNIAKANHLSDTDHLKRLTQIIIPKAFIVLPKKYRKGIVINIATMRLYYFKNNNQIVAFPVALGKTATATPEMKTWVYDKKENPTWHVPESIRQAHYEKTGKQMPKLVPPGPQNPLGHYVIYLGEKGYLIHGNNQPASIGRMVSSGCVRMFNKDIKKLYTLVPKSTLVRIIDYPNKLGWNNQDLYLQSSIPPNQSGFSDIKALTLEIYQQAQSMGAVQINKIAIIQSLKRHDGIPTIIGAK